MGLTTISGTITHSPKRVVTKTGRVMAVATIQAESDKRSAYPLKVIAFEVQALALMLYRRGNKITVAGKTSYWNGYQITIERIE